MPGHETPSKQPFNEIINNWIAQMFLHSYNIRISMSGIKPRAYSKRIHNSIVVQFIGFMDKIHVFREIQFIFIIIIDEKVMYGTCPNTQIRIVYSVITRAVTHFVGFHGFEFPICLPCLIRHVTSRIFA